MKLLLYLAFLMILVHFGTSLKCYQCFNCDEVCQVAPANLTPTECPYSSDMRCLQEVLSNGTVNQRCGGSFDCEIGANATDCGGLPRCVVKCCDRDNCNGGCTANEEKSHEEHSRSNAEVNEGSSEESNERSNEESNERSNEEDDDVSSGEGNRGSNEEPEGNGRSNEESNERSNEDDSRNGDEESTGRSNEEDDDVNNEEGNRGRNGKGNGRSNEESNGKTSSGSQGNDRSVNNGNRDPGVVGSGALHAPAVYIMIFGILLVIVLS